MSYLKINLKSSSAKYRPHCLCLDVLTRCGRDKVTSILKTTFSISFLTSGEIWIRYNNLHTSKGSHVLAALFWGWDKMVPLSRWYIQIDFPVWVWFIFFKFDFSAFLNFHTEIYCIILSSCTERGSNAVHRMTSLLGNVSPDAALMCGPWVTVGCLHMQRASDTEIYLPAFNPFCPVLFAHIRQKTPPYPVKQRYICPRLIPFALFFLLTSVKRHPLSNNMLTVIRFRVGYVHLSLILI